MTDSAAVDADTSRPAPTHATREWLGMSVVGAGSVIVDFGVFNLLLAVGSTPAVANLAALAIATFVAYLANLRWTFSHREITNRSRALILFFVVNIASAAAVQVAVMAAAAISLDVAWLNGVKFAMTVVATIVRFVLYRTWVYQSDNPEMAGAPRESA